MSSPTKSSRSWSLKSRKEELKLTQAQKRRSKITKGVDPTRAITEDEPFQVNQSKNHYRSLSQLKFKDRFGNNITDPDLSNPTRHRWESPLETIRGFEVAIYKDEHRGSYLERTGSNAGDYSSDAVDSSDGNSWKHRHQQQSYYHQRTGSVPRGRPPPDALHYISRSAYYETPRSGADGYGESDLGFSNMGRRSPGPNASYGYAPHPSERMGRPPRGPTYGAAGYDEGPSAGGPPNQTYAYTYPTNGGGESPITNPGSSSSGAESDGPGGYIREPALPQQQSFGFRDQVMFESSQQIVPFEPFSPSDQSQTSQTIPKQSMPTPAVEVTRKPIALNSSAPIPDAKSEEKKRKSWFKRRNSKN